MTSGIAEFPAHGPARHDLRYALRALLGAGILDISGMSAAQPTREIGIRVALGATTGAVADAGGEQLATARSIAPLRS